jgi:hypothetical protein
MDIIDKMSLSISIDLPKINNKLKIAHIFVHLFEIGGGESYLYNFCKYGPSIIENELFINSNYNNKTLFDLNIETIKYSSYEELNKYLSDSTNNYDLIIDHQLYWFDFNYSLISFNNINPVRIMSSNPSTTTNSTNNYTPSNNTPANTNTGGRSGGYNSSGSSTGGGRAPRSN